ncbi:MAG: molybdopterin molybdotransferase MoeA [Thiothrix sp.]|uniref:molybdopterin molybdotransferase MoeA n=1 Tax=Thiothrix sp. TaxID=1032 RepID=UPI0026118930|nr:gephyrin-like molybdotransferase Glp [Thiothrix sp.]MDD5395115.1 molybdopterin molybdotransferase MoeA [Thiothrix sp.]
MPKSDSAYCNDNTEQHMRSVEEAQTHILQSIQPLVATERVDLRQSLGRILACEVQVRQDVPSHRNSAMDGYAFRHIDTDIHAAFYVAGVSLAGHPFHDTLDIGQCVRIMTGAIVPTDADTVIMQEHVSHEGDLITLQRIPKPGANVRHPGEDLRAQTTLLPAGRKLNAADLGLLASQGIGEVDVLRRPRIAFFSTGDELKGIGETLQPGDVYDSNRYTLYGMLSKLEVDILDMGVIPDQPQAVESAFTRASQLADVVITSGGVSVGDADYVTDTLRTTGTVDFWKIAVKPGKPLAFGKLNAHCLFFGLPGNPVSVMATFLLFARSAILKLRGESVTDLPEYQAICDTPIYKTPGRKDYQRGICHLDGQGQWRVSSTGMQGSHILRSMSMANCFIVLPLLMGNLETGSTISIIPFRELL